MPKLVADGVTLHYQQLGQQHVDGPEIVLIHGLGANLAFWYLRIATRLAAKYRVLIYDLRGHGDSSMPAERYTLPAMAQDLKHLIEYLKIKRINLVGHSFGARVALYFAMLNANQIETLTLADTQLTCLQPRIRLKEWPHWQEWQQKLRSQGVINLPADDEIIDFPMLNDLNQMANAESRQGQSTGKSPTLKQRSMGRKGSANWETLLSQTSALKDYADQSQITTDALQQLQMPLLAMFGEYSHCLPTCWKLKALTPHCEVAIVPGAGHFHPAIKPEQFLRHLEHFLAKQVDKASCTP